tara:strand:- start:1118 stop:2635 length:1518 start_codon:yes stop_codon:yes gene_type:complete
MNIQKIIVIIVLSIIATGSALSQKKIGVFVHGFNGSSEKWTVESKVPQNWKNDGVIDDFVALDYKTEELATEQSQGILLNEFIKRMDAILGDPSDDMSVTLSNRANNEWIIVGHSLGGIVGRLLYPKLRQAGFNVVAVTSIGGPSQGAAAADVDTLLIENQINRIKDNFKNATDNEWPFLSYILNWQQTFNTFGSLLGTNPGPSHRERLEMIPTYLEIAKDSAVGYSKRVLKSGANNKIGVNGELIKDINNFPKNNINFHPQNYLSIIGAEKDKAPIRMIGHIFNDEKTKDEVSNLEDLDKFNEDYMGRNQNHWDRVGDRWSWCAWFSSSCKRSRDTANRKEGFWKTARREISDLGKTWSTIINSYRLVPVSYRTYIPPCQENFENPGFGGIKLDEEICSQNPSGEYRYEYGTMKVSDKNDGVVNIHSVLWSKGDAFNSLHNRYFSDVQINANGVDVGGYNHFELRNYSRAYELKDKNENIGFLKGSKNPAMERVEDWISDGFEF